MEEVDQEKEAMQEKEKTEEILRRRRLRGSRNRSRSSCYL